MATVQKRKGKFKTDLWRLTADFVSNADGLRELD